MPQKLYCYVDESGQDTEGKLFLVTVVLTGEERDDLASICEALEETSGKGRVKWSRAHYQRRLIYIRELLQQPLILGKLYFTVHYHTKSYTDLTMQTIALAIHATGISDYRATILIDGLPRSQERHVSRHLHKLGVVTKKVRGVKKDENDALVRLADAVCGFIREALDKEKEMQALFQCGIKNGIFRDLSKK